MTSDDAPEELHGPYCASYHEAVELVGRRWSGVILRAMLTGATRFSQIRDAIPELTDRMLSERLKELEQRGITERRVEPSTPVRITYHLTPKGEDLRDALIGLQSWAERWAGPAGGPTEPARSAAHAGHTGPAGNAEHTGQSGQESGSPAGLVTAIRAEAPAGARPQREPVPVTAGAPSTPPPPASGGPSPR